jgi:putative endonuclease
MLKKKTNVKIGIYGEKMAADYLRKRGFVILGKNISYPWGEIDIVAKDRENTLVFVEVKTLDKRGQETVQDSGLRPEDNLTQAKLLRLRRSCSFFANNNPQLTGKGWRIDLVSLTIMNKNCVIKHLENIG